MPQALPKALKSKTVATPGELKQVGLRFSSAAPLPPASAREPAEPPHPPAACWSAKPGGGRQTGAQLCAGPGPGAAGWARSPGGCPEPPRRAELRAAHRAHPARSRSCQQLLAPA